MNRAADLSFKTWRARFFVICIVTLMFVDAREALAEAHSAGAYYMWNRGPVREIGLAGASAALDRSPAAVVGNPGLIGLQSTVFNGTFDFGTPQDTSLDFRNAKTMAHRYLIFGASTLLADRIGIGFGASQVRFLSESKVSNFDSFSDTLLEMSAPIALRVAHRFSLGAAFVRVVARRETNRTVDEVQGAVVDSQSGNAVKFGLSWALAERFHFGIVHRTSSILTAAGGKEGTVIKNSFVPPLTQFGFMHRTFDGAKNSRVPFELRTNFQLDIVSFEGAPEYLYYAPGVAYGELDNFRLSTVTKYIPRLSLELVVLRKGVLEFKAQGGMYVEPPLLTRGLSRTHVTGGASLVLWYLSLNVATDFAQNYQNQNLGIGLANLEF